MQKGLGGIQVGEDEDYPEEVNEWFAIEEEAREQQLGFWQFGGVDALDEDAE